MHAVQKIKQTVAQIQPLPRSFASSYKRTLLKIQSLKYSHRHQNSQRAKRILKLFLLIPLLFVLIQLAMKHSQAIEVDENFFAYRQRDLERKRKRAKVAHAKNAQIEAKKPLKHNKPDPLMFKSKLKGFPSKFHVSNQPRNLVMSSMSFYKSKLGVLQ